jgi:hypothetical protein
MGDLDLVMDELQCQNRGEPQGLGFMMNDRPTSWRPLYPFLCRWFTVAGTTDPGRARVPWPA